MTTLAATHPTLLDIAKRLDPDNSVAQVIEALEQTNDILKDAVWIEGNLPTGHRTTIRTGLPEPTFRKLYGYVQPTKSTTAQVTDSVSMMEAYAEIDVDELSLNGNSAAWLQSENMAFVQGMNNAFATNLIYGNEQLTPEKFTGFDVRFNSQSAANGENILTSDVTPDGSDNTSIWLIGWGPRTVHCIYPKGSPAGLQVDVIGERIVDSTDGRMKMHTTRYQWKCGLAVRDWRYVVRINFDLEDVVESGATGPVLANLMAKGIRRLPSLTGIRPAFYLNRDAWDALDLQANSKATLAYKTTYDAQGIAQDTFRGIPLRRCDAILSTESGI